MKFCLSCSEFSTSGVLFKIASSDSLECTLFAANEVYKEMLNYIQILEIFMSYKSSYKASLIDSCLIKKSMIFDFCYMGSVTDLVRYTNTNMRLSISTSTISRILRQYNMISYIAPRKPRITPKQRRVRTDWCNEHLSRSIPYWSQVIFSHDSNYEVLNQKNRIYFRDFRTD